VLLAITAAGAYLYARLNPPPGPAQASENRPFAAYARPIPPASPGLTVLSDLEKGRAGWEPALGQTATGFGELSVQKGMAADGSFWLRAGGIRFHGDWGLERGGVYYNPDSNDWSLLGNVVRAQLYLPPAAPPALRARLGIRNTLGQWLWMPGPGAALRPGRWNLVQWKADVPALADVSRLAVVLEGKNIAYSGAFGVDGLTVTRK
ncbi:MAG: hypothetical protein IT210_17765, partial [Armatimonadetes bacterium]|nr:hypothetical protein [Armatimonadota bacterium]